MRASGVGGDIGLLEVNFFPGVLYQMRDEDTGIRRDDRGDFDIVDGVCREPDGDVFVFPGVLFKNPYKP